MCLTLQEHPKPSCCNCGSEANSSLLSATSSLLPNTATISSSHDLVALPGPVINGVAKPAEAASNSEDELSEAADSRSVTPDHPSAPSVARPARRPYLSDESSLHEDDAEGSDDADFEGVPQSRPTHLYTQPSSSSDDVHDPQGKGATPEDEKYMHMDPELYGLRRSVCLSSSDGHLLC